MAHAPTLSGWGGMMLPGREIAGERLESVKTGMTAGLEPPPFAGEPDLVAADVVRALDRRQPIVYTPGVWKLVMLGVRWLPRFVMRKIEF